MRRTVFEAISILVAALTLALVVNGLRPGGIRVVRGPEHAVLRPEGSGAAMIVSFKEAVEKFDSGDAVFIDARLPEAYAAGHPGGAVNLPVVEFKVRAAAFLEQFEPDTELIAYCVEPQCPLARELAERLQEIGFANVSYLIDGWDQWQNADLPIVSEQP